MQNINDLCIFTLFTITCSYLSRLPWVLPGAPLIFNGTPGNTQDYCRWFLLCQCSEVTRAWWRSKPHATRLCQQCVTANNKLDTFESKCTIFSQIMHLKMLSAKYLAFCLGLNMLICKIQLPDIQSLRMTSTPGHLNSSPPRAAYTRQWTESALVRVMVHYLNCCLTVNWSYRNKLQWNLTPWWRHQMETLSALLAICAGNSPASGDFPAQRPVTRSFDVFFDLRLNKRLRKQSQGWWFETLSCPLWRHRNAKYKILIHGNAIENVVCKMVAILSRDRWVKNTCVVPGVRSISNLSVSERYDITISSLWGHWVMSKRSVKLWWYEMESRFYH